MKKQIISFIALFSFTLSAMTVNASAVDVLPDGMAKSALLIERSSGNILYEKNADEHLPIASVTKVMTILLIAEALESGRIKIDDGVTCSDYASTMGGSQIWLKPGEVMTVDDMLKAITVASANDCCVAMAEFISGSEQSFVALMNQRAAELGMTNTQFKNCNGLDENGHYSSARDVALMSRELLKHKMIMNYTTIWMDTLRGGTFGLANTNKLLRSYKGITGLKTGSTGKALFCISATAERDGMELISVILGSNTSKERFTAAASLLDYGYANWSILKAEPQNEPIVLPVVWGKDKNINGSVEDFSILYKKGNHKIESELIMPPDVEAPVVKGQIIGEIIHRIDGTEVGRSSIKAVADVERMGYFDILKQIVNYVFRRKSDS